MSREENVALAHRVIEEAINGRRPEVLYEVIAEDYVENAWLPPGSPTGREGLKAAIEGILGGFSDFHYTIEDEIVEGDKIVQRLTAHGTHDGTVLGLPPTGRNVTWSEVHIGRIQGGKFVEHWAILDLMSLMQQLGAIPTPEATTA